VRSRRFFVLTMVFSSLAVTPAVSEASSRPVLMLRGTRLVWTAAGRHDRYLLSISAPGRRRILTVRARSVRPPAIPGTTVTYRVRAAYARLWSNPVAITYPGAGAGSLSPGPSSPPAPSQAGLPFPAPLSPAPASPPGPEGMTVALDAGGWGPGAFSDVAGAAKAVRLNSRFATDSEVGGAAAAGVTVAAWLFGTAGTIAAVNPSAYAAEIVAVFKRYGKGGTFWHGRPDLGGGAVEILNEPNNRMFWTDPNNVAAYFNLLKVVHDALAANFPAAIRPRVLASWDGGEGTSSLFGQGWAALGGLSYCDGVTVHAYEGSTGEHGSLGGRFDAEGAQAASGKPVYITEVGWPTAVGQPATGDSQQSTEAQQAENITNFFGWARSTGYVKLAVYFNYVDYGSNTWYGIERRNRSHKPSFGALGRS
jgi:hypothetical protein